MSKFTPQQKSPVADKIKYEPLVDLIEFPQEFSSSKVTNDTTIAGDDVIGELLHEGDGVGYLITTPSRHRFGIVMIQDKVKQLGKNIVVSDKISSESDIESHVEEINTRLETYSEMVQEERSRE
jgi:hypothetical protein